MGVRLILFLFSSSCIFARTDFARSLAAGLAHSVPPGFRWLGLANPDVAWEPVVPTPPRGRIRRRLAAQPTKCESPSDVVYSKLNTCSSICFYHVECWTTVSSKKRKKEENNNTVNSGLFWSGRRYVGTFWKPFLGRINTDLCKQMLCFILRQF